MSQKYPGGFITKSPVAPTTTAASGVWTLDQQQQYQKAGTWPSPPIFIEDLFSTYLYTGTGASLTITNGIDLSGKGGLVWIKNRENVINHNLYDTARGVTKLLRSNTTEASETVASSLTAFNNNGFTLSSFGNVNGLFGGYASWTFRKQPKFFDVVTWTGNGASNRLITHALGAIPAVIMIKATSTTGSWYVSIRDNGLNGDTTDFANAGLGLESTSAKDSSFLGTSQAIPWTSTQFTLYATGARTNVNGVTYVAYLFAHNAGGFGLTGTDNVISCGSYTAVNGTSLNVNLGFEPQWLLVKKTNLTGDWWLQDNMRGFTAVSVLDGSVYLKANSSAAESIKSTTNDALILTSTGFTVPATSGDFNSNGSYIYIAIRRGPMKTPTDPTKVFSIATAVSTNPAFVSNGVVDMGFNVDKSAAGIFFNQSRLAGANYLNTRATSADTSESSRTWDYMNGMISGQSTNTNNIGYMYSRAPGFFDVVCYTGTGANQTLSHNLQAVPELIIVKNRSGVRDWGTGWASIGWGGRGPALNSNEIAYASVPTWWNSTAPTASVFTVGSSATTNGSGSNFVAYLFATLAGVSKVGSYTGTGATQTISCGFTGGARSVIIKRTDSTGDWYLWDTTRGMVSGTDPSLLMNSAAAEVNANSVYTTTGGFEIVSTAAGINASGGTYIFLAIA